ncbi:hypothetical protein SB679_23575, partial [Chryseobacterium sp. SIMBA_029]
FFCSDRLLELFRLVNVSTNPETYYADDAANQKRDTPVPALICRRACESLDGNQKDSDDCVWKLAE